jgi:hypothetical protein
MWFFVLQALALRALSPAEREVLLLLGSDVAASQGQLLIQENDKVTHAPLLLLLLLLFILCPAHSTSGLK